MLFYSPESMRFGIDRLDRPPGDIKLGSVVQDTEHSGGSVYPKDRYGHIVGFGRNSSKELILRVQWDDGITSLVSSFNLILLTR